MAVVQARLAEEAQLQVVTDRIEVIAADLKLLDKPEPVCQATAPSLSVGAILVPVAHAIIAAFVAAASTWLVMLLQITGRQVYNQHRAR